MTKFMYVVSKYFSAEPIFLHYFIAIKNEVYINIEKKIFEISVWKSLTRSLPVSCVLI